MFRKVRALCILGICGVLVGCQSANGLAKNPDTDESKTRLVWTAPLEKLSPPPQNRMHVWVQYQDVSGHGFQMLDAIRNAVKSSGYQLASTADDADYYLQATLRELWVNVDTTTADTQRWDVVCDGFRIERGYKMALNVKLEQLLSEIDSTPLRGPLTAMKPQVVSRSDQSFNESNAMPTSGPEPKRYRSDSRIVFQNELRICTDRMSLNGSEAIALLNVDIAGAIVDAIHPATRKRR